MQTRCARQKTLRFYIELALSSEDILLIKTRHDNIIQLCLLQGFSRNMAQPEALWFSRLGHISISFSLPQGVSDSVDFILVTVDIGDDTIAILEAYKESMTSESRKGAEKSKSDIDINKYRQTEEDAEQKLPKWIFTNGDKDIPMFPHTPTRYFKQFGERYNIPGFHPHLLRHTSATLSLTNGGDAKSVADRLGHADAAVLLRVYAHANDASIRKAGQAVRDALKKQKDLQSKPLVN